MENRKVAALSKGLAAPIEILRPLAGMKKADTIRLGRALPLELTEYASRAATP